MNRYEVSESAKDDLLSIFLYTLENGMKSRLNLIKARSR